MIYDFEYIPNDWKVVNIEQVGKIIGGGTPSTKNEEYWGGNINWFTPTEITNLSNLFIFESERKITKEGLNNSSAKLIPENSLLFTSRATIGACAINSAPASTNQGFQNIVPIEDISVKYLYYFFSQPLMQKRLIRRANGSTFLEISGSEMRKTKILLPPKIERIKIVGILENIDFLIQITQRLIEKLQECKKGLMHRLFTEGIGHTEFKDTKLGRIPKEWNVKKLSELVILNPQYNIPEKKDYAYLPMDAIDKERMAPNYWERRTKESLTTTKFKNGDILFAKITPSTEHGKGALIKNFNEEIGFGSTELVVLSPKEVIFSDYLFYYTKRGSFRNRAVSLMEGATGRQRVPTFFFKTQLIAVPKEKEQQQIARILSNINNQITNHHCYGAMLKKTKKGLMQVLLTGIKRV